VEGAQDAQQLGRGSADLRRADLKGGHRLTEAEELATAAAHPARIAHGEVEQLKDAVEAVAGVGAIVPLATAAVAQERGEDRQDLVGAVGAVPGPIVPG